MYTNNNNNNNKVGSVCDIICMNGTATIVTEAVYVLTYFLLTCFIRFHYNEVNGNV